MTDPHEAMIGARPTYCADCNRALYGIETCPCCDKQDGEPA